MNIGFDGKRYFHNTTGLGNYSRTLVNGMAQRYPQHRYFLFNPKKAENLKIPHRPPLVEVLPAGWFHQKFSSLWRSRGVVADLLRYQIQLYHGLSHELPWGIHKSGIPAAVTVHDLIFERYPQQYGRYEVNMHRRKIQHACRHANAVIAISKQTRNDLVQYYGVPHAKIFVCYQSCDPFFAQPATEALKVGLRQAYGLPAQFFLYVGSINERKNLMRVCQGMKEAKPQLRLPLVVVGAGGQYAQAVKAFVAAHRLPVIFLNERTPADAAFHIRKVENLAALYQMATALVYPSLFEGFGIPVLEALWSRLPVVTSNSSCLPETGGDAALYVDPLQAGEIGAAMVQLQEDSSLRQQMANRGWAHAQRFTVERSVSAVMQVYEKVVAHGSI